MNQKIKNIVLIGMRGSGKSTVAKIVAQKMQTKCVEMDSIIEHEEKMSINDMVASYGWEHFRDKESALVERIAGTRDVVVSTGGGVVVRPQNIELLKKDGKIFYLRAKLDTLADRLNDVHHLPKLTDSISMREELSKIMLERIPLYEQSADIVIDVDGILPDEVALNILQKISS